ncbi:MAG: serine/threonine protein kinase, partial [Acidobacteriota bacterium]|nr:serine/threonine protein kinase [Acidobacteriota bacterium]
MVRKLLDRVLDDPADRPRLLAELRTDDPEASGALERLLKDVEEGGDEADDRPLSLPGGHVGPYTVVREIGRGGAGTVFLGSREEAGVRVNAAIKILRRDFLRGTPRRAFQRELRALARLDHANIARLLDWGEMGDGLFYLAIEYVDGPRITQFCAEKRMGIAERLGLFLQVCGGVAHAHRNLLLHRDLKPSNILVSRDGRAKLVDFGVASELDAAADHSLMTQAFTPAYASPEQFEGRALTVASDVYSLGLVLYEL